MKIVSGYKNAFGPSRNFTGKMGQFGDTTGGDETQYADAEDGTPVVVDTSESDPNDAGDMRDAGADTLAKGASGAASDNGGNIPPEYMGDPIFLSASTVLSSGSSLQTPNQEALRNPFPFVVEVCEIRFLLTTVLSTTGYVAPNPYNSPAGNVGVILSLSGETITQAANGIPINLLCPGQQLNAESVAYGSAAGNTLASFVGAFAGSYRLVLKTPIKLLPNELLDVQLSSLGVLNSSVTVQVSYLGRTRADLPIPDKRVLPYFASFNADSLYQPTTGDAPNVVVSKETDLQNVFDQSIRINRFVGRINGFYFTASTPREAGAPGPGLVGPFTEFTDSSCSGQINAHNGYLPGSDKVLCGMTKSTGTPTIAPNTPFRLAFDGMTRSWELDDVLAPRGYYIAQVEVDPPSENIDHAQAPVYIAIGMHAERTVAVGS